MVLAAPSIETCPHDSILVAESCKCNIDSCVKPSCLYELVLTSNGTEIPGKCCPTYSCTGCSNDTAINDECPCAPDAFLVDNICTCQDPYKSLKNNECICDPNLCELPQLCDDRSVAVTDKEGCCSKTKCIKCPEDSYKAPQNHNGEFEDICVCYPCQSKKECGSGEKVEIVEKGTGFPEHCCDLYICEPDFSKKTCETDDDVVYAEGAKWETKDLQICECKNGLSFCKSSGKESFNPCHEEGAVYQHLQTWARDSCTNCSCMDGAVKCVAELCATGIGIINKAGCQPVINCEKVCHHGFMMDEQGCKICECSLESEYDDILQTFNISKSKLYKIVEEYFSKSNTTTITPILVSNPRNESGMGAAFRDSGNFFIITLLIGFYFYTLLLIALFCRILYVLQIS